MDEREALLRAVAAHPDEDTPRLMYADLLDELGGSANTARARFIRLQVATHRGPGDTGGTWLFDQQTAEARELGHRFGTAWVAELPTWARPFSETRGANAADVFARGFVERVRANPKQFVLRASELCHFHPICTLEFRGGTPELLGAVLKCSALDRLRCLVLRWRGFGSEVSSAIAACPHLAGLRELDLSSCALCDRDARILSRSDRLSGLRVLRLQDNRFSADAARMLIGSPRLSNLRKIDLRGCAFSLGSGPPFREQFPNKTVLV